MNLLNKLSKQKKEIEAFVEENGMEEAVKKYGLSNLIRYFILMNYSKTNLYFDDRGMIDKVYTDKGVYLGDITHLMSPYYKKLGYHFGPCLNGNIILAKVDKETNRRTYAIFDKDGNQIINYGKYTYFDFLPNGVAISGNRHECNAITVHYNGTVVEQPFVSFSEDTSSDNRWLAHKKIGDEFIPFEFTTKAIKMYVEGIVENKEKGIE